MLVALPFAVMASGGGTGAVGLVVAAQLAPFVVFGLLGGAVSDRSDRRRILIHSDLGRMAVQACAGALLLSGAATPVLLGVLVVFYGTAEAFFQPAFTGLLPQTVSHPGQLQRANALRGLSFSVAAVAGPALAGVLVARAGPGAAFLFDAGSFAVSMACLLLLRPGLAAQATEAVPPPFGTALRDGWLEVSSRSWLRCGLAALSAYHALVLPAVFVLGPVFISHRLGGPGAWAAVVVAFGLGSIAGDLALLRIVPARAPRRGDRSDTPPRCKRRSTAPASRSRSPVPSSSSPRSGVTIFFTLWEVSLQEHVPAQTLSRVSSWDYLSSLCLMPVGTAVAGRRRPRSGPAPRSSG